MICGVRTFVKLMLYTNDTILHRACLWIPGYHRLVHKVKPPLSEFSTQHLLTHLTLY